MIQKRPILGPQALKKLTDLCAKDEHCFGEMLEKICKWGLAEDAQARIMEELITSHYADSSRYTESFVYDKIRYNKWGRRKVEQVLWVKKVDSAISSPILDVIEDEEYLEVLHPLLASKYRTIKAESNYECSMKPIKFTMGCGFTMDLIRRRIDEGVVAVDDDVDFAGDDTDD